MNGVTEKTYRRSLIGLTILLFTLIVSPYAYRLALPDSRGYLPFHLADEASYFARIQAAVHGRYDDVGNGYTGPVPPVGDSVPAKMELLMGASLGWTGLQSPEISLLFTALIAPLTLPLLAWLLRRLRVRKELALGLSVGFVIVFWSVINRQINHALSAPVLLLALHSLLMLLERPSVRSGLLAGVLLGITTGIYFWMWTYLWAVAAALLVLAPFFLPRKQARSVAIFVLLALGVALLFALPALLSIRDQSVLPHILDVELRNGIVRTHGVESVIRSVLVLLLGAASVGFLFKMPRAERTAFLFPAACVLGIAVALHQNVIHGKDFMFSSHYYPYVGFSALLLSGVLLERLPSLKPVSKHAPELGMLAICAVLFGAALFDYGNVWRFHVWPAFNVDYQWLAPAVEKLNDGKRDTIFTDDNTGLWVLSWTDDSVLYTQYMQALHFTNEEYVERYCLSRLFDPKGPDLHWMARELVQYRSAHLIPERVERYKPLCDRMRANPKPMLEKYGVTRLLWNEKRHPDWDIDERLFQKTEQGEGWSLWNVR